VIKTAFVHARLGADVVHTDRAIAALPDKVDGDREEFLFGIGFRLHESTVVDRSV
jgi:hypothetical protein